LLKEICEIVAQLPMFELKELDPLQKGQLMLRALDNVPDGLSFVGHTRASALEAIEAGRMTFLFDDEGNFIGTPFAGPDAVLIRLLPTKPCWPTHYLAR
jgi:hypothetical protein